ncbi:response regulator [Larkinella soli]|uniref:response regulator n=1 Tax=Larkinella soli TaxID=1770527 RepID=UPI001E4FE99D|nr:response regulator [Larkinella soli]
MEPKKYVLLVDDDPEECELLGAIARLEWPDFDVHCQEQVAAAWNFLEAADSRPLLIILDVNLQEETSLELLVRLKAESRFRPIPVLILTGYEADINVSAYLQAGAAAYLPKPNRLKDYKTLLKSIRLQWLESPGGRRTDYASPGQDGQA